MDIWKVVLSVIESEVFKKAKEKLTEKERIRFISWLKPHEREKESSFWGRAVAQPFTSYL